MCFNRLADWDLDVENPCTAMRHSLLRKSNAWLAFTISGSALLLGAWQLNWLCFFLSPLMIGLVTFYSLTKRFTSFFHLFLGLALGAAPRGTRAAVRAEL